MSWAAILLSGLRAESTVTRRKDQQEGSVIICEEYGFIHVEPGTSPRSFGYPISTTAESHYLGALPSRDPTPSHAETATITSETPYTDFHNPNKPFDFPEARLITHLASYATVVEIFVPGTSHYDEGEDEWHEHRSEVGYYLDESKLEPKELESGIWSSYLAIVPYQKRFPPGTVMDDWWNVPDLGDRLSLNRIKPIDTLVLWIHDASNTFHQLPSKNLIIALGPRVLRDEAGCLRCIDELPELAVIRYLLDSRAVTSSKVIIQIHPPPYIAIMSCNTLSPSILICWWIQTSWPDETPPLQT